MFALQSSDFLYHQVYHQVYPYFPNHLSTPILEEYVPLSLNSKELFQNSCVTGWTFLSQLMPYVLTSFAWCMTWGAPFALIQVGLGRWSVSLVLAVVVAWWGVYQRLTVHSYSYIDPILILSQSYNHCIYSLVENSFST
jgi:hypothetical protein